MAEDTSYVADPLAEIGRLHSQVARLRLALAAADRLAHCLLYRNHVEELAAYWDARGVDGCTVCNDRLAQATALVVDTTGLTAEQLREPFGYAEYEVLPVVAVDVTRAEWRKVCEGSLPAPTYSEHCEQQR